MAAPKFLEFCADSDDWDIYAERLEQHFAANKVEDEKIRVAVLLSSIGQSTYKLLRDLSFPALPKDNKFDELNKMLKNQYQLQLSTWRERRKFYQLRQTDETIAEWYAKIRSMATRCNFGNDLTRALKDKFVTGLNEGKIFDRICEDDSKGLEDLISLAMKQENMAKINYVSSKFLPKAMFRPGRGSTTSQSHHHGAHARAREAEFQAVRNGPTKGVRHQSNGRPPVQFSVNG